MGMSALQYARAAWSRGVYTSLREVLQAMKEGRDVEMRLINRIMSEILNKTEGAMQKIGEASFSRIVSSPTPNLFGLNELLKERSSYYSDRLNDFKFLIKKFDNPSIVIGRRGQDIVRELSLDTLEEGFLKGNPTAFTETALIDRIIKSPKAVQFADRDAAKAALKEFHAGVVDKIPVFHEDGQAKFMLRVKVNGEYTNPPKYQAWSADKYADLVAITTAGEADASANIAHAGELGTRLVKWNSTGKGKDFYLSIGDKRCARVDGEIASIEEGGTTINGVTYPYYKTLLPGPYNTCHPNCRHRMAPFIEEALDELAPKKDAASPKIIAAQKEAEGYGVKKVDFGSEKNLPIAEKFNTVLKGLVDEGKPVPETVIFDHREFTNLKDDKGKKIKSDSIPAMFRSYRTGDREGSVFVNPKSSFWKDTAAESLKNQKDRWWSTGDPLHVIHHEIGHFLNNKALGNDGFTQTRKKGLNPIERSVILDEVSIYAVTNPLEFVAETYAGIRAGRKFSDTIMRLYARFGGV